MEQLWEDFGYQLINYFYTFGHYRQPQQQLDLITWVQKINSNPHQKQVFERSGGNTGHH